MKGKVLNGMVIMALAAGLAFTAGCAQQKKPAEPAAAVKASETPTKRGTDESLSSTTQKTQSKYSEGRTSIGMLPVYFDFDKFNVRKDQADRLTGNANYLKQNSSVKIKIEGNCDERGTNEYNMALGERRAQSAKKYLVHLGVAKNRVETVSFGEEQPLAMGHDEAAWTQNRRGDFVAK